MSIFNTDFGKCNDQCENFIFEDDTFIKLPVFADASTTSVTLTYDTEIVNLSKYVESKNIEKDMIIIIYQQYVNIVIYNVKILIFQIKH